MFRIPVLFYILSQILVGPTAFAQEDGESTKTDRHWILIQEQEAEVAQMACAFGYEISLENLDPEDIETLEIMGIVELASKSQALNYRKLTAKDSSKLQLEYLLGKGQVPETEIRCFSGDIIHNFLGANCKIGESFDDPEANKCDAKQ